MPAGQAFAPAAAHASGVPAGAKQPCPCPPAPAPGNGTSNKDFTDVAKAEAMEKVQDTSKDAQEDSKYAIEQAGRQNLRGVQDTNAEAIATAKSGMQAHTHMTADGIVSGLRNSSAEGQEDLNYDAQQAKTYTKARLESATRKVMAKYIQDAKVKLADLTQDMKKSSTEMNAELHNTIAVSSNAERMIDKLAVDAEGHANYSSLLWANTQAHVKEAQIDANKTEDQVRITALGTKFSTQAVEHASETSRNAFDMATQANLTGNAIMKKVMNTKAGIEDVTMEVYDALQKASKANIDAHQAEAVATKLNRDAP